MVGDRDSVTIEHL